MTVQPTGITQDDCHIICNGKLNVSIHNDSFRLEAESILIHDDRFRLEPTSTKISWPNKQRSAESLN